MESVSAFHLDVATESLFPRVELHIACRDLIDLDTFSKSDPQVILYTSDQTGTWKEHGRTEMIK
jgi:hypothetical protein